MVIEDQEDKFIKSITCVIQWKSDKCDLCGKYNSKYKIHPYYNTDQNQFDPVFNAFADIKWFNI